MVKGLNGLNPGNKAFKQFKCPVLIVLKMDLHEMEWGGLLWLRTGAGGRCL